MFRAGYNRLKHFADRTVSRMSGVPNYLNALYSNVFHRVIVYVLTRTGSTDTNQRFALIALYCVLSVCAIPALALVYACGPLVLLGVSCAAVLAATRNTGACPRAHARSFSFTDVVPCVRVQ